ncbi:VOC family protein [Spiractinospora alimapuensis]|uniref:VOC family protein n=1 Tax=Spiractinospora alimapuensis TaxID=2820884 RepID=UPI001F2A0EBB|nr:VOC family protein [Spiractinospora alimapuensis]QVQ51969.1 VOC family protein [Spiractinospora alimapuensis]
MLGGCPAHIGISVTDPAAARKFYEGILGVPMSDSDPSGEPGDLVMHIGGQPDVWVAARADHVPSRYPVLTFRVDDISGVVAELHRRGVDFLHYDGFDQDEKGVVRADGEPPVAWFSDPAGNVLALRQEQ